MTVVQPGTVQAYEVTPIYSRISGYVQKYLYDIGARVKAGDVLIEMWIPDLVEAAFGGRGRGEAGRCPDPRDRERPARRRRQAGDDDRPDRVGPGGHQAGAGELYAVGIGIQAARAARRAARPRRPGPRRDLPPVRGGGRGARPGRGGASRRRNRRATRRPPTATAPASTSRPPRPSSPSPRRRSARPASTSNTARSRPPTPA